MKRSREDLRRALAIQRRALDISAAAYDAGEMGEAARLAATVHILLGPRSGSHVSVIEQLGFGSDTPFFTTVEENSQSGSPLVFARLNSLPQPEHYVMSVLPRGPVAARCRKVPLAEWWEEPVLKTEAHTLARRKLVRLLRDKDGGAHFDGEIRDPLIIAALRGEITGFLIGKSDGTSEPVPYSVEATMRQIAEEVQQTITKATPADVEALGPVD